MLLRIVLTTGIASAHMMNALHSPELSSHAYSFLAAYSNERSDTKTQSTSDHTMVSELLQHIKDASEATTNLKSIADCSDISSGAQAIPREMFLQKWDALAENALAYIACYAHLTLTIRDMQARKDLEQVPPLIRILSLKLEAAHGSAPKEKIRCYASRPLPEPQEDMPHEHEMASDWCLIEK